ncbi:hypothetical protein BDV12DRAFT_177911 [Aspergillus spectabilis]
MFGSGFMEVSMFASRSQSSNGFRSNKLEPFSCSLSFALSYRRGFRPGNGDKKVRCEAGTYTWLEENCPDIPIPRLYGFAMATGEMV